MSLLPNRNPKTGEATTEAKPPETPAKEPRTRRSKFADQYPANAQVKVLVKENPKKEGSKAAARFQHYFTSKTVGEFLEKGGQYSDIMYDLPRGFIEITVPPKAA